MNVAFWVAGTRTELTLTPANCRAGTKTYALRETVTAGPT